MTQNNFEHHLIDRAKKNPKEVLLPEGDDERVVDAAKLLVDWGVARTVTLLKTTGSVTNCPSSTRIKVLSAKDPGVNSLTEKILRDFFSRKRKIATDDTILSLSANPLYQAGALLQSGAADSVVAGCASTTSDVIKAALSTVGLMEHIKTVSGSFIMSRPTSNAPEVFLFADCGVVIDPSVEQLCDIAESSCKTLTSVTGLTPVVAFLSFSTKGSSVNTHTQKMAEAAKLFLTRNPLIESDGEFQFDSAYVQEIGQKKAPGSLIPGRANCFIFPDLNSGNISYKIAQRLAGFSAYGPILQGFAKPYCDLSRGASAHDIAMCAVINSLRV